MESGQLSGLQQALQTQPKRKAVVTFRSSDIDLTDGQEADSRSRVETTPALSNTSIREQAASERLARGQSAGQ
jgi:hypothetical protein